MPAPSRTEIADPARLAALNSYDILELGPEPEFDDIVPLDSHSQATFELTWCETGGPVPASDGRAGFGSCLIRMGLAGAGTGVASLDYEPSGLVAVFKAPLTLLTET